MARRRTTWPTGAPAGPAAARSSRRSSIRLLNIFCVVDLHALTIPEAIDPVKLYAKSREVAALYVACGIDPERSIMFVQSKVSAHAELQWILNCVTPVGWLERMTQYKVKAAGQESVGTGLRDYPVLQAADILLYQTHQVPVGEDQRQHIELTRDIASRFNHLFGEAFTLPEVLIRKSGARIMAFDDPTSKMSKSIGAIRAGHSVGLLDSPDEVRKTIMRAATDSGSDTRFETGSAPTATTSATRLNRTTCTSPRSSASATATSPGSHPQPRDQPRVADRDAAACQV
ncbi:MAG: tryptophan--tRNA ligase [Pseudonocardia sp.]